MERPLTLAELRRVLAKLGYEEPQRIPNVRAARREIRSILAGGFGEEGD